MRQEGDKNWIDAIREKMLSNETTPAPASWAMIGRRVRRSVALRRGAVAAAFISVLALLLWSPWRPTALPSTPPIAQISPVQPAPTPADSISCNTQTTTHCRSVSVAKQLPSAPPVLESEPPVQPRDDDDVVENTSPVISISTADITDSYPVIPDLIGDATPRPARQRHRLALRMHATADMGGFSSFAGTLPLSVMKQITEEGYWMEVGPPLESYSSPGSSDSYAPGEMIQVYVPGKTKWVKETIQSPQALVFPVTVGVSLNIPLSRRWTLTTGLDYSQRPGNCVYNNYPQSLAVHYLGIPVEVHYVFFPESRVRVYAGAGVKAEKSLFVTGGEPLREPVLFSANLQAGADFRILPGVRLYVAPVLSQYLNKSIYINSWDTNLHLSLRLGMSIEL